MYLKMSFDEITPEKVTTLNCIKLPKTTEQWLQANAYFFVMLPYNNKNITDIETHSSQRVFIPSPFQIIPPSFILPF